MQTAGQYALHEDCPDRLLHVTGNNSGEPLVSSRRDLKFGATDDDGDDDDDDDDDDGNSTTADQPAQVQDHVAGGVLHPAGIHPFRRSVSFSQETHTVQPRAQLQRENQDVPFDSSNLPDGITAIPVADPNDPSVMVMQVSCPQQCVDTYHMLVRLSCKLHTCISWMSSISLFNPSCVLESSLIPIH